MDKLLVSLGEAREAAGFDGTLEDFKNSESLIAWAIKSQRVVRLQPQEMTKALKERYTNYLVTLTRDYLSKNPEVGSWQAFSETKENRSIQKLLHQFGVRGEVFGIESFQGETLQFRERSSTGITIEELHELYQIQFHFNGTLAAFKRAIQRQYGSFAEFCILKGYDINTTRWEDDEAAVRVAKRLGSLAEVKKRSQSLFHHLTDNALTDAAFGVTSRQVSSPKKTGVTKSEDLRLSKTKVMAGMQCSKRLYLTVFPSDRAISGPADAFKQAIFDQGNEVGLAAQKAFPGGVLIDSHHYEPDKSLAQTESAIRSGAQTIYEATFLYDQVLVRIDILHRNGPSAPWQILEVKSTTSVKEQHVDDAAIQAWVLQGLGHSFERVSIVHLNNQFIHPSGGDLFVRDDVTNEVENILPRIPSILEGIRKALKGEDPPEVDIGPHCSDPYECEFRSHCWNAKKVPELSVMDIPGLTSKRKWAFYKDGIIDLSDSRLSKEKLNPLQKRMIAVSNTNTPSIDGMGITNALEEWTFPLYFLDFETINPAIPRYKGTRPYQQIPFQFSCETQSAPGASLLHHEYLHDKDTDPRLPLVEALVKAIGSDGSIVAYNMAFESTCLNNLALAFPKYAKELGSIRDRLVDPLPIIKACVYYKGFNGSFSIKDVAPALLGPAMGYDKMAVSSGTDAQLAYYRLISAELPANERNQLKHQMLEYCRKDTLAMTKLVDWLYNASGVASQADKRKSRKKIAA